MRAVPRPVLPRRRRPSARSASGRSGRRAAGACATIRGFRPPAGRARKSVAVSGDPHEDLIANRVGASHQRGDSPAVAAEEFDLDPTACRQSSKPASTTGLMTTACGLVSAGFTGTRPGGRSTGSQCGSSRAPSVRKGQHEGGSDGPSRCGVRSGGPARRPGPTLRRRSPSHDRNVRGMRACTALAFGSVWNQTVSAA